MQCTLSNVPLCCVDRSEWCVRWVAHNANSCVGRSTRRGRSRVTLLSRMSTQHQPACTQCKQSNPIRWGEWSGWCECRESAAASSDATVRVRWGCSRRGELCDQGWRSGAFSGCPRRLLVVHAALVPRWCSILILCIHPALLPPRFLDFFRLSDSPFSLFAHRYLITLHAIIDKYLHPILTPN